MHPLTSRLVNMVPPVDISKVAGSTFHAKSIHVMAEAECNRLYCSQKKANMVEGVVINVDLQITKKRRKQLYVIDDKKNPDVSVKRSRLHIEYVFAGTVLVPVHVNLQDTAHILTSTTTTIVPANPSNIFPDDHSTPVEPAPVPTTTTTTVASSLLPTTTTVINNCPTIVAPAPEPKINTTVPSNPPTTVSPEPDTTTTTRVYANPPPQNDPVPDPTQPPQNSPVPDLTPPTVRVAPLYLIQLHLLPLLLQWLLIVME